MHVQVLALQVCGRARLHLYYLQIHPRPLGMLDFTQVHHLLLVALLLFSFSFARCSSLSSSSTFLSSQLISLGNSSCTMARWLPLLSSLPGAPHCAMAMTSPCMVPGAICTCFAPCKVSTTTVLPSNASKYVSVRRESTSFPCIRKLSCSSMFTWMYKSPTEPSGMLCPCPFTRSLAPCPTPAGTLTRISARSKRTCVPPHVLQNSSATAPAPPHAGHGRHWTSSPPSKRTCATPHPPQASQTCFVLRLLRNVAHDSHGRKRSTCTSVGPPRTHVANGTETNASASQVRPWLPAAPCLVRHVDEEEGEAA
mmetsp:Transcript_3782/g.23880  ORF Transcript_3782/g.23880 Transcript_3782/m.23880 type:complete len:310 (-) Transcript_3782:1675-2604(-)